MKTRQEAWHVMTVCLNQRHETKEKPDQSVLDVMFSLLVQHEQSFNDIKQIPYQKNEDFSMMSYDDI